MKIKLPTIVLCLLAAFPLSAKDIEYLVIHFETGNYSKISLEDEPLMKLTDGIMSIENDNYQISNIRKYTFEDNSFMGIHDVIINSDNYKLDRDLLYIYKTNNDTAVKLYLNSATL